MVSFSEDTSAAPALPAKPTVHTKVNNEKTIRPSQSNEPAVTQTTSLSLDQVNDNADELVELRGEGRYFGVDSSGGSINAQQSLGPLCANCHKRGHIRAKCKTVVCHKCGIVGDHYETQCPTTMVCAKCGQKGHIAANCTNKQKKREYCKRCDTFSHSDDRCPSIWRSYLTTTKDVSNELPVIYCYNCGDSSHYGDECPEARQSRVPNPTGSAFSGQNLPRNLRQKYFDRIRKKAIPRQRSHINSVSSHNFSRTPLQGSSRYSHNGGNNLSSRRDYHSYGNSNNGNSNNYRNQNQVKRDGTSKNDASVTANKNIHKNNNAKLPIKPSRSGVLKKKNGTSKKNTPQATRSGILKRKN